MGHSPGRMPWSVGQREEMSGVAGEAWDGKALVPLKRSETASTLADNAVHASYRAQ